MPLTRLVFVALLLGACTDEEHAVSPENVDSGDCRPFRAYPLNLAAGCLEELIEFRCDNRGCNDEEVDAVDAEGNCYRMLGCAPPDWKNSSEDELPEQCEVLLSSESRASESLPLCSDLPDATARDAGHDAAGDF